VVLFVLIACFLAPSLNNPKWGGVFTFIQEFQGFVSPGVLAVFIFGFFSHRTPRYVGWLGILINVVAYGVLKLYFNDIAFLNRMAISFAIVCAVIGVVTLINPLKERVEMPQNAKLNMESSKGALWAGLVVCALTIILYAIFW
jgi:SSS family solute:Na+ symporter